MKRSVHNLFYFKRYFLLALGSILLINSFAQTVTIVPSGTPAKPNLIPVNNTVTFSINPIGFGSCMNNLSYAWALLNSKGDTLLKSTASSPKYNFAKEDVYTISLTVKTLPGGSCASNITRMASSTVKAGKQGAGSVPNPTMFSANALGTTISAYTMDNAGQIISGPYDYFDPFPADNAITAALSMDDKGNFFYLPTFMNGPNPLTASPIAQQGVVEVWAVDKNANNAPVVIARFDMNGASTTELGLYRMGLDQKGNAWILAGDGTSVFATTFKTNGTKPLNLSDVKTFQVPFESGSAADFQSGDLAFDNKGNMYILAGSSSGVNIYTMSTSSTSPKLSKKWKVTDAIGKNFGLAVTGTVFDSQGDMYFSALDGIYFIDYSTVNAATATAVVQKVSDNFGLMDLATSQFPAAWTPPSIILPVRLIQFTGTATTEKVYLNWRVAANETGNYFELERSYNGTSFKTQALLLNTDKQGEESYSFVDAASSGNVYYRLKIVNKDGSITYSNIVFFRTQTKQSSLLALLQNPVQSALNFNYIASQNVSVDVTVYTCNGVKVLSEKHNLQKGNNSITISLNNMLMKGIYLLEINDGYNRQAVRFVKE